ncbi:MAG: diaminopimelate epimerase [Lentisphaerae bacterium]|jgi:diaminopimelate epimerase|nr:diaminopimelate epimerase [Lentisphaerota bacterium]
MKINFTKMHGAGNDFVMIDDRQGLVPWQDHFLMASLATRRLGIGCEGILLIQKSERADFRMVFLNPDGTQVDMCGNGSRCAAAFAHAIGAAGRAMTMETCCGLMDAELTDQGVKVWMPEPSGKIHNLSVEACGLTFNGSFMVSGVPHFVVEVEDLAAADVVGWGRALRQHPQFHPEGTNVNFVTLRAPDRINMRTYERGVEGESGACGTGAVACAIAAVERRGFTLPIKARTPAGYELVVGGDWRNGKCTGLTLIGPTRVVYTGEIDLNSLESELE